ncbi:monovalent cation/H(+) antiporter subunit G [Oxalobacteraceae bacterium R-40]|uniref:Monovalent cation/H(+) antiporter subunit G n=1 Tax=Keguizhuia sedimenti TaxID=3064264 RepID=A0ABU1BRW6_9BURK|nr:monovalent cation/H(+) antiporter subunit G [Oxalobacteraceae bacterium R-40]
MMELLELFSAFFLIVGSVFFFAGTVGLVRFPDVYTRLHVLAKVDNLGVGFTIAGLLLRTQDIRQAFKLILIWLLVLVASAAVSFLIARRARLRGVGFWQPKDNRP